MSSFYAAYSWVLLFYLINNLCLLFVVATFKYFKKKKKAILSAPRIFLSPNATLEKIVVILDINLHGDSMGFGNVPVPSKDAWGTRWGKLEIERTSTRLLQ